MSVLNSTIDPFELVISAQQIGATPGVTALDILVSHCQLSKGRLKDAMLKGAVVLTDGRGRSRRLRRATYLMRSGESLTLHYDSRLLAIRPPDPVLIEDRKQYSVWYKPAGVLAQGTPWGDHTSLLRLVDLYWGGQRPVFLIHRLDREADGLMLVAHDGKTAGALSELFHTRQIKKFYRITVQGHLLQPDMKRIETQMDGKVAVTCFRSTGFDDVTNRTQVHVELITGRKHQIRRHFAGLGFPVVGDWRYGTSSQALLHLTCMELRLPCPTTGKQAIFALSERLSQGLPGGPHHLAASE